MSKVLIVLVVASAGCVVSQPSLLSCSPGEAAVVQPDGAWGCQLVALHSTEPLGLFVRTDGSDTTCSGQVNSPAPGNGINCAVASLQHAIDLVPDYIGAAVTITIGAGTFVAPAAQPIMAEINKAGRANAASITIQGSGTASTTLEAAASGGDAGMPTSVGIEVAHSSMGVTVENLTVSGFADDGFRNIDSSLTLTGVAVQQAAGFALECLHGAQCFVSGTCTFENGGTGLLAQYGSEMEVETGATVTVGSNSKNGIQIDNGSQLDVYGDLTVSTNQGSGIDVYHGSSAYFHGGDILLIGNGGPGLIAESFGDIQEGTTGTLTIQVPSGGGPGIHAVNGGYINVIANTNTTAAVSISCTESSSIGIEGDNHSTVDLQGAGGISVSGCGTGIEANYFSYVRDLGGGGSRSDSSNNEYVNNSAIYLHGGFPAALCAPDSQLWCQ